MGLRLCDRCGYVCDPHGDPDADDGVGGTECRCPIGVCPFCTAHETAAMAVLEASCVAMRRGCMGAVRSINATMRRLRALSKEGLGPDGEVIL